MLQEVEVMRELFSRRKVGAALMIAKTAHTYVSPSSSFKEQQESKRG
jgi:hypothetical protein